MTAISRHFPGRVLAAICPDPIFDLLLEARHRSAWIPHGNRILVVQLSGLGNAIYTTPLIQALATLEPRPEIDVLADGNRGGTIAFENWDLVRKVWTLEEISAVRGTQKYDRLIECHPNTYLPKSIRYRHRTRFPVKPVAGVEYHWLFKKHESEHMLDMAAALGYRGPRPPLRRLQNGEDCGLDVAPKTVAVGIGYQKAPAANGKNWAHKHWGNENFIALCDLLVSNGFQPVLVGDARDQQVDGVSLEQAGLKSICGQLSLRQLIDFFGRCVGYVGNDSGLMHVAAAVGIPAVGVFINSTSVKNSALGRYSVALGGDKGDRIYHFTAADVWQAFERVRAMADREARDPSTRSDREGTAR